MAKARKEEKGKDAGPPRYLFKNGLFRYKNSKTLCHITIKLEGSKSVSRALGAFFFLVFFFFSCIIFSPHFFFKNFFFFFFFFFFFVLCYTKNRSVEHPPTKPAPCRRLQSHAPRTRRSSPPTQAERREILSLALTCVERDIRCLVCKSENFVAMAIRGPSVFATRGGEHYLFEASGTRLDLVRDKWGVLVRPIPQGLKNAKAASMYVFFFFIFVSHFFFLHFFFFS
jgi:hypothetical protein